MAVAHILISSPFFALLIILDADNKWPKTVKGHTVVAVFVNELSEAVTLAFGKVERTNSEGQVHVSFFCIVCCSQRLCCLTCVTTLWREDNSEAVATDGSL